MAEQIVLPKIKICHFKNAHSLSPTEIRGRPFCAGLSKNLEHECFVKLIVHLYKRGMSGGYKNVECRGNNIEHLFCENFKNLSCRQDK
jgi:hypothetical protein